MARNAKAATKVLIIDDEKSVAETLVLILISKGYEAVAAHTPETAMQMLNSGWAPDIVLFDIALFDSEGVEVALWIRERCPGCRFILMSGKAEDQIGEAVRRFGFPVQVLQKPFMAAQMLDMMQTVSS